MNNENPETPAQIPSIKKKNIWKETLKEIIIFALIAFGVILPFRIFVAEPYVVEGGSMDPTFATGDYLIVDKLSYDIENPERNSVIVFQYPNDTSKSFIKRIIGLPGETVIMNGSVVTIVNEENPNGFILDQSYITHKLDNFFEKTLATDEYFVMGDNRAESFDSRSWGPLQKKYMLGKPIIRLWPIASFDILPGENTN